MNDHAARLLAAQNPDGGWSYLRGTSWTEPTAYALLALRALGLENDSYARGLRWLRSMERSDGGWPPQAGVKQSTWVTALALLVCADRPEGGDASAALRWLLSVEARGSGFIERLRERLLDRTPDRGTGWPFFPHTAGWVAPTSLSILALARVNRLRPDESIAKRIAAGREFLMTRRCADGGWNHGASSALGYEADAYPETTGLALLAMGLGAAMERTVRLAETQFARCRSAEGLAWLQLGLRAHGRTVAAPAEPVCHTVTDDALVAFAQAPEEARKGMLEP